ncbi:hypothetical protein [Fibrella arboris]|uniref:hypothetical protein n=1 Tax=Fibrella arboris TaxID=3242486 RepID=UPI003520918C
MNPFLRFVIGCLAVLTGCYHEPDLAGAQLPAACRIGLVETIREGGAISRRGYVYNDFGNLTQVYEENQNGQRSLTQTYSYDSLRYVRTREDKTPTGTTRYAYTYDATSGLITRIAPVQGSGTTWEYAWEGNRLKSLTIKSPGGTVDELLTFQDNGKLATRTRPGTSERFAVDPATGYLTSYTHTDGVYETFTVNNNGNHLVKTYNEPALSKVTSSTYTYTSSGFYNNTQLRFRGIPDIQDGSGKPGLLTQYVLNQFRNGQLTLTERVTFQYSYNGEGYALGYAASTGERGKFYYTNCAK